MKAVQAFTTDIFTDRLTELSLPDLLVEVEALRASDPGVERSNIGGYHSQPIRPVASQPTLGALERFTTERIRQIATSLGLGALRMNGMWANISGPGARNEWHFHQFTVLSAVFYCRTPEGCGGLRIERPDIQSHYWRRSSEDDPRTVQVWRWDPQPADLLIFPAYLRHEVEENRSTEDRVSIAMNYSY